MGVITILLGLLPGFTWLFFFMQEDPDGEPREIIISTFLIGVTFAFFALITQIAANDYLGSLKIPVFSFAGLLVFAGIEELFKFWGAYFSVHKNPAFDVPTDAMIFALVSALGFATIENLAALGSSSVSPGTEAGILAAVFQTVSLRFAGATLLHALTSSIVGYHWALSLLRPKWRTATLIWGLVAATVLHAIFNYLILLYGRNFADGQFLYPLFLVGIIGFFVLADFAKLNRSRVNIEG